MEQKQEQSKKGRKLPLWVLIAVAIAVTLCCFASMFIGDTETPSPTNTYTPSPARTAQPTNTLQPTDTPKPIDTPKPTNTSEPEPTDTPEENLRKAIEDALGDSNRDIARISEFEVTDQIFVQWAINDNLTEDMIKGGAQLDITEILQAVSESEVEYNSVRVYGTFPLVDSYGNVEETEVVKAVYTLETLEKINWDNFLFKNVYEIADSLQLHPTFQLTNE